MVQLSIALRVLATSLLASTLSFSTPIDLGEQNADVTCGGPGGNFYPPKDATKTLQLAFACVGNGTTFDGYPRIFQNKDGLPMSQRCAGQTMYEFPLVQGGMYSGGSSGPDRVVVAGTFGCAIITHIGASNDGFKLCSFLP